MLLVAFIIEKNNYNNNNFELTLNQIFQSENKIFRRSRPEVFCNKGVLPEACNFTKKEILAQVFSCEFFTRGVL